MGDYDSENDLEATSEQIELLRELGVDPLDVEGMSLADAQALIDELRSCRGEIPTSRS